MSTPLNIVYLYSEVMPYAIAVMRALVAEHGANVSCIWWDEKKRTPFIPVDEQGINFYKRSGFDEAKLNSFLDERQPAIIYIVGRMDPLYMKAVKKMRKRSIIVTGSDNQWLGNRKQRIAAILSPLLYKRYFHYFWVPGKRQYLFARKMGYNDKKIIPNLLTADTVVFNQAYDEFKLKQLLPYPHNIVFAGRFSNEKGIDLLIAAFTEMKAEQPNDWKLVLVGSGNMAIPKLPYIVVKDFMSGKELAINSKDWGVFCLPSTYEPWGVVVHEFAAAGLPFICSDSVGAADALITENESGFIFKTGDKEKLKAAIKKIIGKNDSELYAMSAKSHELSLQISPSLAAKSLMSVLHK